MLEDEKYCHCYYRPFFIQCINASCMPFSILHNMIKWLVKAYIVIRYVHKHVTLFEKGYTRKLVAENIFSKWTKVRLLKIWESADDLRSNFGRICKQSLVFFKKRIWLVRGLNPGPLACEASVLTIQLLPLLKEIMKTWEVILILVCFEILPLWLLPFLPTSF